MNEGPASNSEDTLARARAAARSMSTPELIALHGQGQLALAPGTWKVLDEELQRRHRMRNDSMDSSPGSSAEVVVTDIQMPFWSMVWFMVKWSLASIPAVIILFVLFAGLYVAFVGFMGGFSR